MKAAMLIALLACTSAAARAQSTQVPLVVEHGVLFVRAFVNGTGPLLFVFDPGAADFVTSYTRERLKGAAVRELQIGRIRLRDELPVLPGDPQQIVANHDVRIGNIAGSIGPNLLRRYAVRVEIARRTMALTPFDDFRVPAGATALPFTLDPYGLPAIAGAVDNVAGRFEVDVRAPHGLLFTPFVHRGSFLTRYSRERALKRSGALTEYAVRSISVAGYTFRNVPTWFSAAGEGKFASSAAAGLFGNDVLSNFALTFDYRDHYVILGRSQ